MAWKGTPKRLLLPLAFAFITIVCVLQMTGSGPFGGADGSGGSSDFTAEVHVDEEFNFHIADYLSAEQLESYGNYTWWVLFGDGEQSGRMNNTTASVSHKYHDPGEMKAYLHISYFDEQGEEQQEHREIETLRVLANVSGFIRNAAIVIFIVAYIGIVAEKIDRTIVAIAGATIMVALGVFHHQDIGQYISWETLGLIFGMFTMVTVLAESGFFRWIGLHTLRKTEFKPIKVFILFSAMAAFLSAFMDSITVLLFMATLTIEVCRILDIKPIPFLIAEITSANIGGSATMVGDPPNIIIGTGLGYSFMDFVTHTGVIAVIVFFANLGFFLLWYRKYLKPKKGALEKIRKSHMDLEPKSAIEDPYMMWVSLGVFIFAVGLLVIHGSFNISVALIGLVGASLTLLLAGREKMIHMVEKIDWGTLLFFGGLFVLVGGLEATGVLRDVAHWIANVSGDSVWILLTLILWMSAFLSAFIDNVPFAATMVPVLRELSNSGFPQQQMAYTLALGADIGGNGTPIGASANVVGLSVARRNGVKVSWGEYLKVGMLSMMFSVFLCMLLIFLAVGTGWWR